MSQSMPTTPRNGATPIWHAGARYGGTCYSTLGIARADTARMAAQMGRNYTFLGAPVDDWLRVHG